LTGSPSSIRFSRKKRHHRWVGWSLFLALALVFHAAVLAVLAFLPDAPSRDRKTNRRPVQHVVQLHKPTKKINIPPKPGDFVSTEDRRAETDTVKKEPRIKPSPAGSRNVPRPRREKPVVNPAPPPAPMAEAAEKPALAVEKPAPMEADSAPTPVKLFPTAEEAERILGISPETTPQDVNSGKENSINSQKWMGASFFLRVREAVAQAWDPEKPYRANDPDGTVYGYKNWFTVLSITLDAQGRLLEPIIISQPSGLRFLDLEAIRAVRAAAPFLNPPKEIADPVTGRIKFRFGFLVEVNAGLNFRMFRF